MRFLKLLKSTPKKNTVQYAVGYTDRKLAKRNNTSTKNMKKLRKSWTLYPLENRINDSLSILDDFITIKIKNINTTLAIHSFDEFLQRIEAFFSAKELNDLYIFNFACLQKSKNLITEDEFNTTLDDLNKVKVTCLQKKHNLITEDDFNERLGEIMENNKHLQDTVIELFWNNDAEIWKLCNDPINDIYGMITTIIELFNESAISNKDSLEKSLSSLQIFLEQLIDIESSFRSQYYSTLIDNIKNDFKKLSPPKEPCFGYAFFQLIELWPTFKEILKSIQHRYTKFDIDSLLQELSHFDFDDIDSISTTIINIRELCDLTSRFYDTTILSNEANKFFDEKRKELQISNRICILLPQLGDLSEETWAIKEQESDYS